MEQGCQGDQGGVRTFADHESGLPISVLVKDPVLYRNEHSCYHDENGGEVSVSPNVGHVLHLTSGTSDAETDCSKDPHRLKDQHTDQFWC